jgi:hypothetical protein
MSIQTCKLLVGISTSVVGMIEQTKRRKAKPKSVHSPADLVTSTGCGKTLAGFAMLGGFARNQPSHRLASNRRTVLAKPPSIAKIAKQVQPT